MANVGGIISNFIGNIISLYLFCMRQRSQNINWFVTKTYWDALVGTLGPAIGSIYCMDELYRYMKSIAEISITAYHPM